MVKNIMKWPSLIIAMIVLGVGFSGCGGAKLSPAVEKAFDTHQVMYTKRNMFISKFGRYGARFIETTNYGNGQMIPVNTRVNFKDINKKQMSFTYDGGTVMLQNIPKYSNTTMDQMVKRYFGTKPIDLSKFTKLEQDAIKSGYSAGGTSGGVVITPFGIHASSGAASSMSASKVVVGMSKAAVLVSRGYPPTHATSSTKSNSWKYWESKFNTRIIEFKNNKVVRIID